MKINTISQSQNILEDSLLFYRGLFNACVIDHMNPAHVIRMMLGEGFSESDVFALCHDYFPNYGRPEFERAKAPRPVSNLVRFIESHDGCLVESYDGPGASTIKVSSEIRQPDGTIERQTETIPATLKAVKDWLGY